MRMIKDGAALVRESAVYREIASNLDEIHRLKVRNNALHRAIIEAVEAERLSLEKRATEHMPDKGD